MVDPGHDAGDGELLFGQQRDDEVVLVVAGGRHHHIDGGEAGPVERGDLTGIRRHPGDVEGGTQSLHQLGILLKEEHLVTVGVQVGRDGGADAPRPCDGDLHFPPPSWARPSVRASISSNWCRASSSTAMCRTSPSWPTSSRTSSRGTPARVTETRLRGPGWS